MYNHVSVFSCDFCNCYLGLNPQSKKNIVGLRYHYMSFTGTHIDESDLQELNLSEDDFWETRERIELHGQFYPNQKLQLLFSAPIVRNSEGMSAKATDVMNSENTSSHTHSHTHGTETESAALHGAKTYEGFGDPMVIANYQVLNKTGMDSSKFSQRLFTGLGVKIPAGEYKLEEGSNPEEMVHMPGTGSWDFLLSASYLGKVNRTGVNVNISYLLTTENDQSFEFGNRINANATFYYQVDFKKHEGFSMFPNIGAYYEQAAKDYQSALAIANSGGSILFAHAGLDIYFKRVSVNTAFQIPAMLSLNQPQPEMQYRVITGITYSFN